MLLVQFGFLLLLSFPDLTIPMLLFHLLLFDPAWLPRRPLHGATLHYDGECGICHAAVRFALAETPRTGAALAFRPMQLDVPDVENAGSWCLVDNSGRRFEKTAAAVRLMEGWRRRVAPVRNRSSPDSPDSCATARTTSLPDSVATSLPDPTDCARWLARSSPGGFERMRNEAVVAIRGKAGIVRLLMPVSHLERASRSCCICSRLFALRFGGHSVARERW